jgi:hypothetical protein
MGVHQVLEHLMNARASVHPNDGVIDQIKSFAKVKGDGGWQRERLKMNKHFGSGKPFIVSAALLMHDIEDAKNTDFTDQKWQEQDGGTTAAAVPPPKKSAVIGAMSRVVGVSWVGWEISISWA